MRYIFGFLVSLTLHVLAKKAVAGHGTALSVSTMDSKRSNVPGPDLRSLSSSSDLL